MSESSTIRFSLHPQDNEALQNLCGWHEEHLAQIETRLGVSINHLGFDFQVSGDANLLVPTQQLLINLYQQSFKGLMDGEQVHLQLTAMAALPALPQVETVIESATPSSESGYAVLRPHRKLVRARTANQHTYIRNMHQFDVNFGIGPAGTGKTYMAVARAVELLENEQVRRLILTRPAVEAG